MTMTMERLTNGMTKEEIISKIESLKKGAAYSLEYRDGAIIRVTDDIQIVSTIVMDARFKINYSHTKLAMAAEAIRQADSVEKWEEAERAMSKLNAEERRCLSGKIQEEYSAKKLAVANKQSLWLTSKKNVTRNTDENYPYIVYCKNEKVQLSVNRAYMWDLQKKDFVRPIRKYYMISKGKVGEISSNFVDVLVDVAQEARELAGKKDSAPTPFYSINIENICGIYEKRR